MLQFSAAFANTENREWRKMTVKKFVILWIGSTRKCRSDGNKIGKQ